MTYLYFKNTKNNFEVKQTFAFNIEKCFKLHPLSIFIVQNPLLKLSNVCCKNLNRPQSKHKKSTD